MKRVEPGGVDRHEVSEVELQRAGVAAGTEQFGYLLRPEAACEPDGPLAALVVDADPTVHGRVASQD